MISDPRRRLGDPGQDAGGDGRHLELHGGLAGALAERPHPAGPHQAHDQRQLGGADRGRRERAGQVIVFSEHGLLTRFGCRIRIKLCILGARYRTVPDWNTDTRDMRMNN